MASAFHNGCDNAIQNPLLAPTRGQLFMIRPGSVPSNDIGGTAREKGTKGISRFSIQWGGIGRGPCLLQPVVPCIRDILKSSIFFHRTEHPLMLGLPFNFYRGPNELDRLS